MDEFSVHISFSKPRFSSRIGLRHYLPGIFVPLRRIGQIISFVSNGLKRYLNQRRQNQRRESIEYFFLMAIILI
jgi:hypothetical protein